MRRTGFDRVRQPYLGLDMKNTRHEFAPRQQPIRVGIVGAGNWATYAHVPALQLLPNYRITAVATRHQESAKKYAQHHRIPYAFGNYEEMVQHPEVDLVAVLTIAPQHEAVVRSAIAAGKGVFCEWPLTTTTAQSLELLNLAESAGVRHLIGLQRRLAPSFRYLHDLLFNGYVGKIRSVRLNVSEPDYYSSRSQSVRFTIPSENFTHVAVTFGGHFMDALFAAVGQPREFSAQLINQFKQVTIMETGEILSTDAPNEFLLNGLLDEDIALSIHVEGGKRSGYGMDLTITGTDGDLKVSNAAGFHNQSDNKIEGAQGKSKALIELPTPSQYQWVTSAKLPSSVLEIANVYAAPVLDVEDGGRRTPTFADAVRLHRLLDTITEASISGRRMRWHS